MAGLSAEARRTLVDIARRSVGAAVRGEPPPELPAGAGEGELAQPRGVFVTLKTRGRLRGCLGHFEADVPLAERVADMARASALDDPRFFAERLAPGDLAELELDISVLSPLEEVADPMSIELGRDGIYVTRGGRSGCYLPQAATETGWDKERFLSSCCSHKAGLPADAWKDPETTVYRFGAEIIESPAGE